MQWVPDHKEPRAEGSEVGEPVNPSASTVVESSLECAAGARMKSGSIQRAVCSRRSTLTPALRSSGTHLLTQHIRTSLPLESPSPKHQGRDAPTPSGLEPPLPISAPIIGEPRRNPTPRWLLWINNPGMRCGARRTRSFVRLPRFPILRFH